MAIPRWANRVLLCAVSAGACADPAETSVVAGEDAPPVADAGADAATSGDLCSLLQCSDGIACNGAETCDPVFGCLPGFPPPGCCATDADCETDRPCLLEGRCEVGSGTCSYTTRPSCDDGVECNGLETCDPATGQCVEGSPLPGCCTSKEDCEDGNPCNGIGNCDLETQTCGVDPPVQCDDGNPCNGLEACDPSAGCAVVIPAIECDDGNPCNGVEACDAALGCLPGTPKVCDDSNLCNGLEACDPEHGCLAGTPPICVDANPCNGTESCAPDVGCIPGTPIECDDDDACNGLEACDPTKGCVPGSPQVCDDGNLCNGVESCAAAIGCLAGVPLSCDDGDPCNGIEACDLAKGCTTSAPLECDDGNLCNGLEGCGAFVGCVAGDPLTCPDDNACNGIETCHPSLGCVPGLPLDCNDGDSCTGVESCHPALGCVSGAPLDCGDGDACTGVESCDPAKGCVAGTPLLCDDANICNGIEGCDAVVGCVGGVPLSCQDDNLCNGLETCNPALGCVPGILPECNDSDACNGVETCDTSVGCVPGAPPKCDDSNPCNGFEACVSPAGCAIVEPGLDCDDGNLCNGPELCLPEVGCAGGLPLACDDGDACNGFETCDPLAGCAPGTGIACDDGLLCTADACDPLSGLCSHPVTTGGCAIGGACLTPLQGSDDNPCVLCDPSLSQTAWSVANDGFVCEVFSFGSSVCTAGECAVECEFGRGDCNESTADGCEVDLAASASHCGSCGDACEEGYLCAAGKCTDACEDPFVLCSGTCAHPMTNASHCGGCDAPCLVEDPLSVGVCVDGQCITAGCPEGLADADGDPGNSCEYPCQFQGPEICDGEDDDCDGEIDQGFDLDTDVLHCGACQSQCSHPTVDEWLCVGGQCVAKSCKAGLLDEDGGPANGCESAVEGAGVLWVDAFQGDDTTGDGSLESPLQTLQAALAAAGPSFVIHLADGAYQGPFVVPAELEGLWLQGAGSDSSLLYAGEGARVLSVRASGVQVRDLRLSGGRVGLEVYSPDATVSGVSVSAVSIDSNSSVTPTLNAMGLNARDAADLTLEFVDVIAVTGSVDEDMEEEGAGKAVGISLTDGVGVTLRYASVFGITGGDSGEDSNAWESGGSATGVRATQCSGLVIDQLQVASLTGGIGKEGNNPGAGGAAIGIRLEEVTGLSLDRIALLELEGGRAGDDSGDYVGAGNGGVAHGLMASSVEGLEIRDLVVSGARGGRGSNSAPPEWGGLSPNYFQAGNGGQAVAVYLLSSEDVLIEDTVLGTVVAGDAGQGGKCNGKSGGDAFGLRVSGVGDLRLDGLEVRGIRAGSAPSDCIDLGGTFGEHEIAGLARGVEIKSSGITAWKRTLVHDVRPGQGPPAVWLSAGVVVDALPHVALARALTVHGVGLPGQGNSAGVYHGGSGAPLGVGSALVHDVDGPCFHLFEGSGPFSLTVDHALATGCTQALSNASEVAGLVTGVDPLFVDPASGDLHLKAGSLGIDAGKPNPSDFCDEPAPNGCVVNLGFYGGTGEATPSAIEGTPHCGCDP